MTIGGHHRIHLQHFKVDLFFLFCLFPLDDAPTQIEIPSMMINGFHCVIIIEPRVLHAIQHHQHRSSHSHRRASRVNRSENYGPGKCFSFRHQPPTTQGAVQRRSRVTIKMGHRAQVQHSRLPPKLYLLPLSAWPDGVLLSRSLFNIESSYLRPPSY